VFIKYNVKASHIPSNSYYKKYLGVSLYLQCPISQRFQTENLIYRSADKSLARLTSRFILFDGENISFDASLVIYINSTTIPPIMFINRIYEYQNLLSLYLVSFLVGLRTYQHPCTYIYFSYRVVLYMMENYVKTCIFLEI
jgi:hypothetical protein